MYRLDLDPMAVDHEARVLPLLSPGGQRTHTAYRAFLTDHSGKVTSAILNPYPPEAGPVRVRRATPQHIVLYGRLDAALARAGPVCSCRMP